jgi:hypothetical protein
MAEPAAGSTPSRMTQSRHRPATHIAVAKPVSTPIGLCGAAVMPLAARAQQVERVRRIGVLMNTQESDPEWRRETAAFVKQIKTLGWTEGGNVLIDYRFWSRGHQPHGGLRQTSQRRA